MQERYEIRDKLGQGGLGAVYRAWDHSLNREVAVKRIITNEDFEQKDEATRQMTQETGALAAIQHPHIVTIYDVGTDDDGPFVVMELIKGGTIDEIVEKAPLTWEDFRNFILQVQEGLIAAQDLNLVHRDLKPSNIMINWLPSGKFQVKIVDFGLAKFSRTPSTQTSDHKDSVYGSIFFMAPEQFERLPLDSRTDMYAIGCVYYFSLTGVTPFQGDTGPQVMASHLEHRVVPLAQLRPDIPSWAADWVMWHINRRPDDRPTNAREALKTVIQLDQPATQVMSTGSPEPTPNTPKRPRLIIPGASPEPAAEPAAAPAQPSAPIPPPAVTQTAPQALEPPSDAPPSVHITEAQSVRATPEPEPAPTPAAPVQPVQAPAAAVPVQPVQAPAPPQAAVPIQSPPPAVQPSTVQLQTAQTPPVTTPPVKPTTAPLRQTAPVGTIPAGRPGTPSQLTGPQTTIGNSLPPPKKGLSGGAKIAISSILGLLIIIIAISIASVMSGNKSAERYNTLVNAAAVPGTKELAVNSSDLDLLLNSIAAGKNKSRETVYKALSIAVATDGSDIDARIVEFATEQVLPSDIRVSLLSRVVRKRKNPSVLPMLLDFARKTDNEQAAAAAITAVTEIGGEEQLVDFIDVIQYTGSAATRRAAENAAASALKRSKNSTQFGEAIANAYEGSSDDNVRHALIRLLGPAGGPKAEEIVSNALSSDEKLDTLAAIEALKFWADSSQFETLIDFLDEQSDETIRPKAFDAGYVFLTDKDRNLSDEDSEDYWKMLARNAKNDREQFTIISGLAKNETSDWAISVIEYFADESESDKIIDRAQKALDHMRDRTKVTEDKDEGE